LLFGLSRLYLALTHLRKSARKRCYHRFRNCFGAEGKLMKHFAMPLFLSMVGLLACTPEAPRAENPDADTAEVDTKAVSNMTQAAPAASPETLPLKVGRYVIKDTPCKDAANAAIRMFDGKGLSGSATKDCKANIARREGTRYTVDQSCVDTYNGKRASEAQVIVVDSPEAFTLVVGGKSTAYQYCAA
jgi:zona occludens toxin (predicted ATPase)